MYGATQPPQRSVLVQRATDPFTGLVQGIVVRHGFLVITSAITIAAEFVPVLLANIPQQLPGKNDHDICVWATMAILCLMVLVLLVSLYIKWPHMPTDPRTIAGATYYVAESTMLVLFEGLGELEEWERRKRVRELGRRFGYGDCVSLSGRRRYGIDADGGVVGEIPGSSVLESKFSSLRTKITSTISTSSLGRSFRGGDVVTVASGASMDEVFSSKSPALSVAQAATPNVLIENESGDSIFGIPSRSSSTGYLGRSTPGYERVGEYDPGDNHSHHSKKQKQHQRNPSNPGSNSGRRSVSPMSFESSSGSCGKCHHNHNNFHHHARQKQPMSLLEAIQKEEEMGLSPHQSPRGEEVQLFDQVLRFQEKRISQMSGYYSSTGGGLQPVEEEGETRPRDSYFGQDTGYKGFRLDSTD